MGRGRDEPLSFRTQLRYFQHLFSPYTGRRYLLLISVAYFQTSPIIFHGWKDKDHCDGQEDTDSPLYGETIFIAYFQTFALRLVVTEFPVLKNYDDFILLLASSAKCLIYGVKSNDVFI